MDRYLVIYKKYIFKVKSFEPITRDFVYETDKFTTTELYEKLINEKKLDFPNENIHIVNVIKL